MSNRFVPWSVAALAGLVLAGCGAQTPERSTGGAGQVVLASHEGGADVAAPAAPQLPPLVLGTAPPNPYSAKQIERGRQLVEFGGCNDCHTPWVFDAELGMPVPDMSRELSGHPRGMATAFGTLAPGDSAVVGPTFTSFVLPIGSVYTANLTPDIDTGTGSWTEQMFLDIFRTGRHLGGSGRPVLPPMPWPNVASLPDQELVAIFAYLRSIQSIRNLVPSPDVPEEVMWAMRDSYDKLLGIDSRGERDVLASN